MGFTFSHLYFEGSQPDWCISSMIYSRDTPFWSEALNLFCMCNIEKYHRSKITIIIIIIILQRTCSTNRNTHKWQPISQEQHHSTKPTTATTKIFLKKGMRGCMHISVETDTFLMWMIKKNKNKKGTKFFNQTHLSFLKICQQQVTEQMNKETHNESEANTKKKKKKKAGTKTTGSYLGQVFLLLCLWPVTDNLVDTQIGVCAIAQCDSGWCPGHFFHDQQVIHVA